MALIPDLETILTEGGSNDTFHSHFLDILYDLGLFPEVSKLAHGRSVPEGVSLLSDADQGRIVTAYQVTNLDSTSN